jgi:hypothetical protein
VTLAGVALCVALLAQVFVWAFVHFTDVRVTELESQSAEQSLRVVEGQRPAEIGSLSGISARVQGGERAQDGAAAAGTPVSVMPGANAPASATGGDTSANPNLVESAADRVLRATASVVQTFGIVSAALLVLLIMQGVLIAAGGAVPGVENAVGGMTMAVLTALLAVPLVGIVPDAPFVGVFVSYDTLVTDSMAVRGGTAAALPFYVSHALLPLALMGTAALAIVRFRIGVAQGIIATSVSEAQERIEREIRSRKNLGAMATSRAMGAMNAAFDVGGVQAAVDLPTAPASAPGAPPAQPAGQGPSHQPVAPQPQPQPPQNDPPPMMGGRSILPDPPGGRPI